MRGSDEGRGVHARKMFNRPFWVSPHTRVRFRERFGPIADADMEWILNVQMQRPEIPDAARIDITKRGPALLYSVIINDTPSTVVVSAPSDADISMLPRPENVWPVIMTVYPGRKHIAKYRRRVEEQRARPVKPFEHTWEEWEVETVRLMRWIGYTMREMAMLLQRTERQIERHVPIIQPRWTEDELQMMCDMRFAGKTYAEIGAKLGRSPQACKNRMLRHREWVLSDPERAAFLRLVYLFRRPGKLLRMMRNNDMVGRLSVLWEGAGEEEEAS